GKIIVAGVTTNQTATQNNNIALARYNSNGSLDTTFGKGGLVTTANTLIPGAIANTEVEDMALEPDGSIVVVGSTQVSASPLVYHAFVARYTKSGLLDTSFAGTGIETLAQQKAPRSVGSQLNPNGPRVAVQPADGKIVVGWCFATDVLVRLNQL